MLLLLQGDSFYIEVALTGLETDISFSHTCFSLGGTGHSGAVQNSKKLRGGGQNKNYKIR